MALMEGKDAKPVSPVLRGVFRVIDKSAVRWVGDAPGVHTVSCTVVVGDGRHLCTVQVAGDNSPAAVDSIIVRGVCTPLEAMFDHHIIIEKYRPTWLP